MYNFLVRDFARAASLVLVAVALIVGSLLVMLPDESVPFEYSILRYHTLMQVELLSISLNVWWLYPVTLAKYMLTYIWAYWLPFTFLFRSKIADENFHWFAATWKPSAVFLLGLLLMAVTARLTGRRPPVRAFFLAALTVGALAVIAVAPAVALKFLSANLFVLVKVDSLFFFFIYFVYSATVLVPVTSLVSSTSTKL